MEPENPPTKLPRIAQHGTESRNRSAERGLPINGGDQGCVQITGLGLGLGLGLGCSSLKKCGFTFLQMRELEIQTLIYKYMEAGVPVPYHLIFPIWKSMSSLSVTSRTSSSLFSNYRNKMDAEPRRCRRTDGKKWRCSKDVVSDHKYCQRHLHRGRARARASSSSASASSTIN